MRENVQISYRGARYELGQGPQFYGIWATAGTDPQPLEWWPKTPAGWSGAWARFVTTETPGTIESVAQGGGPSIGAAAEAAAPLSPIRTWIAAGLLGLGVLLGIVGFFPAYLSGASLASADYNLIPHLIYVLAWATAAVLIATGGARLRIGAMLGLATSIVTFGLFFADAGTVMGHEATAGPGLSIGLISWLACAAGSGLAFQVLRTDGPARPDHREIVPVVTLIGAGIGAAIAFAPSWDSYLLTWSFGSTTRTLGNAFSNPAAMIVGDVLVMVAVVAVVAVAALWRPVRHGGILVIGAAIPLVGQAVSALLQLRVPTSPLTFGISTSEAAQIGLKIDNGLTPMFWVYCGFVIILLLLAARMLTASDLMVRQRHGGWLPGPVTGPVAGPAGGWTVAGPSPSGHVAGPAHPTYPAHPAHPGHAEAGPAAPSGVAAGQAGPAAPSGVAAGQAGPAAPSGVAAGHAEAGPAAPSGPGATPPAAM